MLQDVQYDSSIGAVIASFSDSTLLISGLFHSQKQTRTEQNAVTNYSNDIQNAVPVLHEVKYSCDFFLKDEHPAEAGNTKYMFACKHVLAQQSM